MATTVPPRVVHVALVGNPNTGKSTLFNALCGMRQRVGNYPGVTVEKKIGRCEIDGRTIHLVDLPGSYSLAPRSPDEMIAVEVLLGLRTDTPRPDAVICIIDASNLERNLYLLSQVLELNLPTVLALNMVDVAEAKGISIQSTELERRLGIPVVEIQAHRRWGLPDLRRAMADILEVTPPAVASPFPAEFQDEVTQLAAILADQGAGEVPRYLVERLLLDTSGFLTRCGLPGVTEVVVQSIQSARDRLRELGQPVPAVEAVSRYQWVGEITAGAMTRSPRVTESLSDRIDRIATHRIGGTLLFLLVMMVLFESVFRVGELGSDAIDRGVQYVSALMSNHLQEGPLQSLLVDGVIAGVGGVVMFLPQIFVLFLFIAVLEDCGYMARAAYLMDRLMARVGLSGKSFIPLLSSFACAIPGIMSARVIENPRDRLLTILVAPLMSCSARFPVYVLLTEAFIPDIYWVRGLPGLRALVMFSMYMTGIVAAIATALVLRRTLFRGPTPPFVMELPTYKIPGLKQAAYRMAESGWSFLRRAGTLILAVSVLVWAAAYYPRSPTALSPELLQQRASLEEQLSQLRAGSAADSAKRQDRGERVRELEGELARTEDRLAGQYLQHSYLGRVGHLIEPAVRPLGWDWRIGCAAVASFPAREVVVATLGVIYNLGEGQDEESSSLRETLRGATWEGTDRPVFGVPVALSLMVFFSLCAQCVSTLVVMRRETNSWRWPLFSFVYMTTLAYMTALVVYQVASWLGNNVW